MKRNNHKHLLETRFIIMSHGTFSVECGSRSREIYKHVHYLQIQNKFTLVTKSAETIYYEIF